MGWKIAVSHLQNITMWTSKTKHRKSDKLRNEVCSLTYDSVDEIMSAIFTTVPARQREEGNNCVNCMCKTYDAEQNIFILEIGRRSQETHPTTILPPPPTPPPSLPPMTWQTARRFCFDDLFITAAGRTREWGSTPGFTAERVLALQHFHPQKNRGLWAKNRNSWAPKGGDNCGWQAG